MPVLHYIFQTLCSGLRPLQQKIYNPYGEFYNHVLIITLAEFCNLGIHSPGVQSCYWY